MSGKLWRDKPVVAEVVPRSERGNGLVARLGIPDGVNQSFVACISVDHLRGCPDHPRLHIAIVCELPRINTRRKLLVAVVDTPVAEVEALEVGIVLKTFCHIAILCTRLFRLLPVEHSLVAVFRQRQVGGFRIEGHLHADGLHVGTVVVGHLVGGIDHLGIDLALTLHADAALNGHQIALHSFRLNGQSCRRGHLGIVDIEVDSVFTGGNDICSQVLHFHRDIPLFAHLQIVGHTGDGSFQVVLPLVDDAYIVEEQIVYRTCCRQFEAYHDMLVSGATRQRQADAVEAVLLAFFVKRNSGYGLEVGTIFRHFDDQRIGDGIFIIVIERQDGRFGFLHIDVARVAHAHLVTFQTTESHDATIAVLTVERCWNRTPACAGVADVGSPVVSHLAIGERLMVRKLLRFADDDSIGCCISAISIGQLGLNVVVHHALAIDNVCIVNGHTTLLGLFVVLLLLLFFCRQQIVDVYFVFKGGCCQFCSNRIVGMQAPYAVGDAFRIDVAAVLAHGGSVPCDGTLLRGMVVDKAHVGDGSRFVEADIGLLLYSFTLTQIVCGYEAIGVVAIGHAGILEAQVAAHSWIAEGLHQRVITEHFNLRNCRQCFAAY